MVPAKHVRKSNVGAFKNLDRNPIRVPISPANLDSA
jgi:hypothetical protein